MAQPKSNVDKTLKAHEKLYGNFAEQSVTAQQLKFVMRNIRIEDEWQNLIADQREALEMIATKISRILHGDPNHIDSWHDIAGYALLIERRLIEEQNDGE